MSKTVDFISSKFSGIFSLSESRLLTADRWWRILRSRTLWNRGAYRLLIQEKIWYCGSSTL